MDQPVRARPHAQPISRDAGCAAVRADPAHGSRQARHSPDLARRHGGDQDRLASDRQAAAPGSPPAGFTPSLSRAGREIGRAAAGHGERADDPVERLLADAVPTGRA